MKSKKAVVSKDHHCGGDDVIRFCAENNIKLTPLRESILLTLSSAIQPLSAYQILDELKKDNPKSQVMSVYRVLDFLLENKLIHRIESLNAYMSCCHLSKKHLSQWLICETCGDTQECSLPTFNQEVERLEDSTGFVVNNPTIELKGLCKNCQLSDNDRGVV